MVYPLVKELKQHFLVDKTPFLKIGKVLIVLFILSLSIMVLYHFFVRENYEKYDIKMIIEKGNNAKGVIISVKEISNVSINGIHPKIIRYRYFNKESGTLKEDFFKTIDIKNFDKIAKADSLEIKYYNNQSYIKSMEPFSFPILIFWGIPPMFFINGLIFLFVGGYKTKAVK